MLFIFITLATMSTVNTARIYVNEQNNNEHRPFMPGRHPNYSNTDNNGHQIVRTNQYPNTYNGVVTLSDIVHQDGGPNIHRRVDTQYSNQYPYQSSNDYWLGATVKGVPSGNRFEGNQNINNDWLGANVTKSSLDKGNKKALNYNPNQETEITTKAYEFNFNKADVEHDNIKVVNFNYHKQRNQGVDSESDVSINENNTNIMILPNSKVQKSTNVYHSSDNNKEINLDKTNANVFTASNNDTWNTNKRIQNSGKNKTSLGAQDTAFNEVTSTYEARVGNTEEDKWIWSNGEEKMATTTVMSLDDRAAFAGAGCPAGTVKLRNTCVTPD